MALLDEHLPTPSLTSFHVERLARQNIGAGTYLVAWAGDRPVGSCEIRWIACAAPEVQQQLPDCPEISGLSVAEQLRGTGIGTALIGHSERVAAHRRLRWIGLGVDREGNPRAAALYLRLGYRPTLEYTDRWSWTDSQGAVHLEENPCLFLVKPLPDASGAQARFDDERWALEGQLSGVGAAGGVDVPGAGAVPQAGRVRADAHAGQVPTTPVDPAAAGPSARLSSSVPRVLWSG